ncbi:MAG: ribonuclease H family protein [Paludibacteraceae bacterium]|nr:ribonuclease H family protein [Paludibacteraceae bacterium]
MTKKKAKYYVVWQGRTPGIYDTWEECEAQVKGVAARYRSYETRAEAEQAFAQAPPAPVKKAPTPHTSSATSPQLPALAVDAACSGNPGLMEFRGVIADTGTEVFRRGPFPEGTNNIGEFLAIVLGLAYLKQHHLDWNLYSDSRTGLSWLRKKKADTKLEWNNRNLPILEMIRTAEAWLRDNTYETRVLKWDTKQWGEIPADFGRK